jgi:predicted PurR-regulated permease PerM
MGKIYSQILIKAGSISSLYLFFNVTYKGSCIMAHKKKIIIYLIIALIVISICFFVFHFRVKLKQIISPFVLAVIIAYLIYPLVIKLEKRKIPRMACILIIYFAFSILVVTLTIFLVPEIANNTKDLINTLPGMVDGYQRLFNGILTSIRSSNWPPEVKNVMYNEIHNGISIAQSYVMSSLKKSLLIMAEVVTTFLDVILAMLIAYYFIKDAEVFRKSILSLIPKKFRNGIINTGRDINVILLSFIQGQLITALIVGVMESIGLVFVGIKYPIVLGILGGIANIIPYFGPFIGAIPAIAVALIESPIKALWTALVFIIVQQIDNTFISPKIIEGRLGLHPVTTILAVLVGGEFYGIIGMLVSVPLTAIVKVIIKRAVEAIV